MCHHTSFVVGGFLILMHGQTNLELCSQDGLELAAFLLLHLSAGIVGMSRHIRPCVGTCKRQDSAEALLRSELLLILTDLVSHK